MAGTAGTEVKPHTAELAKLRSEVEALREQLYRAEHLATVGTMAAMMAHEFNNILTPIVSYAAMARKNPSLVNKALDHVANGGARATNICRALLGMTHGRSTKPKKVRLSGLVRETLNAIAREPAKDQIDMQIDIPADLKITTRPVELQQVLLNLLINARTAVLGVTDSRRITVAAEASCPGAIIRVADTGVGIEPQYLERIFQPFFSAENSSGADSQGYGLGLAFCRRIMNSLGGSISVESIPGEGATFTLHLPDHPGDGQVE